MARYRRASRSPTGAPGWSLRSVTVEPERCPIEEVRADGVAPVEHPAQHVLTAGVHVSQRDLDTPDDADGPVGAVGHRRVGVDGRDLQRQIRSTDTREVGGEDQQIGPVGQRWERPVEVQLDAMEIRGLGILVLHVEDEILEGQEHPRIDLERQMEIERAAARVLGVEIDLPRLTKRVRLHEMPFIVDMEPVVDGVILEIGDETCDVDDRHGSILVLPGGTVQACHAPLPSKSMKTPADVGAVLDDAAVAIAEALATTTDWGPSGSRLGQYRSDVAADRAAIEVLTAAGLGVLSEESGLTSPEAEIIVVVDPLDGSTNAFRGLSWWATSLCAVDRSGPLASLVVDLRHGTRWSAMRDGGAHRDGERIRPSGCSELEDAIVGLNGVPRGHGGWAQFRALGACALDLCAVADGTLDGYVDMTCDELGVWDLAGAALVCREAGAPIVDAGGRPLVVLDHAARRMPVAGATDQLLEQLLPLAAGAADPVGAAGRVGAAHEGGDHA